MSTRYKAVNCIHKLSIYDLAAPIFNKGKRPRVTLVAHPNNRGGISHEAIHSKENYHSDRR